MRLLALLALGAGCSSGAGRPDPRDLVQASPVPSADADAGTGIDVPPAACGDFCGETFLHEIKEPPNLYFLVDCSGSMGAPEENSALSKYGMARLVLGDLLDVIGHRVRYGASIFPDGSDQCGPGVELFAPTLGGLPACDGTRDPTLSEFLRQFGFHAPTGSTPTAAAVARVGQELEALDGDTYLVLLTDGAPNCNADATCDAASCSLNIDGASLGQRSCSGSYNCCDPDNGLSDAASYCVDADATETEVAKLAAHGIPTFVVGMPGASAYADVLDRLAEAGGTARSGATAYYAADDREALQQALYAIGTGVAIRCSIELDAAPEDPARVNVYFDGAVVPADPDNGWSWDGDTTIRVNGDACDELKSGSVIDARAVFGCETVVR